MMLPACQQEFESENSMSALLKIFFPAMFTLLLAACSGGSSSSSPPAPAKTSVNFERNCVSSACALSESASIITSLETPSGNDSYAHLDVGGPGIDAYPLTVSTAAYYDLCLVTPDKLASMSILDAGGAVRIAMDAQEPGHVCANDQSQKVYLEPGQYSVRLTSGSTATRPVHLLLSVDSDQRQTPTVERLLELIRNKWQTASVQNVGYAKTLHAFFKDSFEGLLNIFSGTATADVLKTLTINTNPGTAWDSTASYPAWSVVLYKEALYTNPSWANPGNCPVYLDCPTVYPNYDPKYPWLPWKPFDPSTKHEFAYYDYSNLLTTNAPPLSDCTQTQYSFNNIQSTIDGNDYINNALIGVSNVAPTRNALYREYMLPCKPNLASFTPPNVAVIQRVMPLAKWAAYAAHAGSTDKAGATWPTYTQTSPGVYKETVNSVPMSADYSDTSKTYNFFLQAAARYPYFCGEQGFYSSIDEACKRDLAAFFGHATQETAGGDVTNSFSALREIGAANSSRYDNAGCNNVFHCDKTYQYYYGRGPFQLSYPFNYGGYSASYFNGDFQFLITNPDLVAYDPTLYFLSGLWFYMTNQPPKPSLHDVMMGRYVPPVTCNSDTACDGVIYNASTGVKNNFNVTIELINGSVECRSGTDSGPAVRVAAFKKVLSDLGASLTPDETALSNTCYYKPSGSDSIFSDANLQSNLSTWIDVSGPSCAASSLSGTSMVSVTAPNVVKTCRQTYNLN